MHAQIFSLIFFSVLPSLSPSSFSFEEENIQYWNYCFFGGKNFIRNQLYHPALPPRGIFRRTKSKIHIKLDWHWRLGSTLMSYTATKIPKFSAFECYDRVNIQHPHSSGLTQPQVGLQMLLFDEGFSC